MKQEPQFTKIIDAHKRILPYIHKTPVLSSKLINEICVCNLFFKCENFQKVGAFKYRGAINAILRLSEADRSKGVCTHSSGNHAQALSLAAKTLKTKAYIVMPENAPQVKIDAVMDYGAKIFFCEPTLESREKTLKEIQKKTGAFFIHPYDNVEIIAGQGTAAIELLEEIPDLDLIMAPVGGGGLMSGTSISAKAMSPAMKIIGSEPKMADDAYRSLIMKKLIPSENPKTIADGLLTSLSDLTFNILSKNLDVILTCTEEKIIEAMKLIYTRMKIIVEPSGAVPLATVLDNKHFFENKDCGLIISGGNLELKNLLMYF